MKDDIHGVSRHNRELGSLCGAGLLRGVLRSGILAGCVAAAVLTATAARANCYSPVGCRCFFDTYQLRRICYNATAPRYPTVPDDWRREHYLKPWKPYDRPRERGWPPSDYMPRW